MVCANGKQNSHIGNFRLNNRPNLPKEPRTSLDIFKMAAELVLLSEALDASIDEELLLDHEEDELAHW